MTATASPSPDARDRPSLKSRAGRLAREAAAWPKVLRPDSRPRVVFLPGSHDAGLLRAWNIAAGMRAEGWNAIALPAQLGLAQRRRLIARFDPALLVFQQARHQLNRPEHAFGRRFVLDCDDADFLDPRMEARLTDMAQQATGVIAGSRFVRDWFLQHNPRTEVIWTSTAISPRPAPPHAARAPILAWAQTSPWGYTDELDFVTALHRRLRDAGLTYQLRLYGVDDEGTRQTLRRKLDDEAAEILPLMPYTAFLRSLREVAVGLSPIIASAGFPQGKSFGKILGYLDAGVPVICSDEADHALFFTDRSGVVSNDPEVWFAAATRLLSDPDAREAMAGAAREDFLRRLTIPPTARRTSEFLRTLL